MPRPTTPWTSATTRPASSAHSSAERPASTFTPDGDAAQDQPHVPSHGVAALTAPPSDCTTLVDALMNAEIVMMDHYSAGKAQSIGGGSNAGDPEYGRYTQANLLSLVEGEGPDGGDVLRASSTNSFLRVTLPSAERQAGLITTHNLRGLVITEPLVLQDFFHTRIRVLPDYRLEAVQYNSLLETFTRIGPASATPVPSSGFFTIDSELSISPYRYDTGGFVNANVYVPGGPVLGDPAIRQRGVQTRDGNIFTGNDQLGQVDAHVPNGTDIGGLAVKMATGSTKQWFYHVLFAPAWPVANGDTMEATNSYSEFHEYGNDGTGPVLLGMNLIWGGAQHWQSVLSKLHSSSHTEEPIVADAGLGEVSIFTSTWLSGPNYPPNPDPILRDTLRDDAIAMYRVSLGKLGVTGIYALGPMLLYGARILGGNVDSGFGAGGKIDWSFSGPHPNKTDFDAGYGSTSGNQHHAFKSYIKAASGSPIASRGGRGMIQTVPGEWRAFNGISLSPPGVFGRAPGGQPWSPAALPQIMVQGDFAPLDALGDVIVEGQRWLQTDLAQAGLDVAYRKVTIPRLSTQPIPPIAKLALHGFTDSTGIIDVYDLSVDFNGGPDVIAAVTSRVVDWGDGSDPEPINTGILYHLTHQYHHGTYTATLTATNAFGLSATSTIDVTVSAGVLAAGFSQTTNADDESGLTIDFLDGSTEPKGTVDGWLWDFGDGNTSALQNPSHTYAAPGTYHVTLTAHSDSGQTDTRAEDLVVPIPGVSDCVEFPETPAPGLGTQGDDLIGGNPPLPNYVDLAEFRSYYKGTGGHFREWYDSWFGADADYDLDPTVTINGSRTLKMIYGDASGRKWGAGWSSVPTDDGTPEIYPSAPSGWRDVWARRRFRLDLGVMSDTSKVESSHGSGLTVLELFGNSAFSLYVAIRAAKLLLDLRWRDPSNVIQTSVTVACSDLSLFDHASLAADAAGEVGVRFIHDLTGNRVRPILWVGPACGMAGALPIIDPGWVPIKTGNDESIWLINSWNPSFTPVGPYKNVWCKPGRNDNGSIYPNPYGYTVPDLT